MVIIVEIIVVIIVEIMVVIIVEIIVFIIVEIIVVIAVEVMIKEDTRVIIIKFVFKGNNSIKKKRAKCRTTDDREIDRVEHKSNRTKRISSGRTEQPHRKSRD